MEADGAKAMTLVELKRLVKCFAPPPRPRLLFPFLDEPVLVSMTMQRIRVSSVTSSATPCCCVCALLS